MLNDKTMLTLFCLHPCNRPQDMLPFMPLVGLQNVKEKAECCDRVEWEAWTVKELMSVGSDLHGKFSNLQVLDVFFIKCFHPCFICQFKDIM